MHDDGDSNSGAYKSSSNLPTFVVLPRGAHPGVQKFLALHKHLFPIRSLKSLPSDLSNLNRLGLVDAQRRDRLGPAEHLLGFAKRVTVVDHVSSALLLDLSISVFTIDSSSLPFCRSPPFSSSPLSFSHDYSTQLAH